MAHACTFLLGRAASEEKPLSTTSTSGLEGRPAKIASAKTKTLQTLNLEHALGRPRARPPSCEPRSENQKPVARNHVQRTRRVLLQESSFPLRQSHPGCEGSRALGWTSMARFEVSSGRAAMTTSNTVDFGIWEQNRPKGRRHLSTPEKKDDTQQPTLQASLHRHFCGPDTMLMRIRPPQRRPLVHTSCLGRMIVLMVEAAPQRA